MAELAVTLDIEEFVGLKTLIAVGLNQDTPPAAPDSDDSARASKDAAPGDVAILARTLLREALAGKLESADLPWPPSPESIAAYRKAAQAAESPAAEKRPGIARKYLAYVLAIAVVVVLVGGYGGKWAWTGFQENGQLWDWLKLLILPVIVGAVPLWIRYRQHIDTFRRISQGTAFAVWVVLVILGYLLPLAWTGFTGQTLWDWLSLFLAPLTVALAATLASTQRQWPEIVRSLRFYHWAVAAALVAGFTATVIGGYGLGWAWTGYQGNTLWDWLSLLLLPVVVPTALLPGMLKWVAGEDAWQASHRKPTPPTQTTLTTTPPPQQRVPQ